MSDSVKAFVHEKIAAGVVEFERWLRELRAMQVDLIEMSLVPAHICYGPNCQTCQLAKGVPGEATEPLRINGLDEAFGYDGKTWTDSYGAISREGY